MVREVPRAARQPASLHSAILSWEGARIAEIPVRHHPRRFGTSKYGVARYFQGAFDLSTLILLTKFSQSPLYLFGLIGLPLFLLGAGSAAGSWSTTPCSWSSATSASS